MRWNAMNDAVLIYLWVERGQTMLQIGAEIGVTRQAVSSRIRRLDLVGKGRRQWTRRTRQQFEVRI